MEEAKTAVSHVLFSAEDIAAKTRELAARIDADYRGKGPLVLVGILKGAFIFMADLARALTIPHRTEFMAVSSYDGTTSSGAVKIVMDIRKNIEGANVLIVEDILDTGRTLHYLIDLLRGRKPLSVEVVVLARKPAMKKAEVDVKYLGFDIDPPEWVVGYGLDYNEHFRTLPYVGVLSPAGIAQYAEKK